MKQTKRPKRKQTLRRRPINVLASVMTTFSLYCGIASIFAAIAGRFETAAYFIGAAMVFDILDGTVARLTRSVSEFGKQLDSLCDLVSFGVAPAVLIYTAFLQEGQDIDGVMSRVGSVMAIIYVICGALRLARYNVYQSEVRDYFTGLPIPAAGAVISSFVLFTHYYELRVAFWVLGPLTLTLAYLMVSTVRYPKDKLKLFVLAPKNAFRFLALCVVGIAAFHYAVQHSPGIPLFLLSLSYALFGIAEGLIARFRRKPRAYPAPVESPVGGPPSETPSA